MGIFPSSIFQSVEFTFTDLLEEEDAFGNDVFETSTEVVSGVILEQIQTTQEAEPHDEFSSMAVQLHLPKTFNRSVENATFKALTGPLTGRVFKIDGDPVGLSYSPLAWNRQCTAREVRLHG